MSDDPGPGVPVEQTTGNDVLALTADFPAADVATLFEYWLQPDLICRWWPQEAEIDPHMGGHYHLAWPGPGFHLRGRYTALDPPRRLAFTWHWDENGESSIERKVDIRFEPAPIGGTRICLTHGRYGRSAEDQEERGHHLDGWRHFLPRLHSATIDQRA